MIGVVGPERASARLVDAVEDAGGSALAGEPTDVVDSAPDAIVASGEAALADLVRHELDVPVLPIDAKPAFGTSAEDIGRLVDGEFATVSHPILDVRVGDDHADRALFDLVLDTTEPGRISEYGIRTETSRDQVRADGVVAATPAGSRGYARRCGGPVLDRGVAAVSVVPIAAFELGADPTVAEPPITLSVERDESPVTLLVDGREVDEIRPDSPIQVSVGDELRVVEARSGLEKH